MAGLAPNQTIRRKRVVDNADLTKESVNSLESQSDPTDAVKTGKKKFVAPEISVPVDVLEATTFFQGTDSGVTT